MLGRFFFCHIWGKDVITINQCLNLKKVDTFGSNTESENETKDTDTTGVQ
jgi:hypothetical protein